MAVVLELLGDVRWRGQAVAGERAQALLAALADAGGRAVPAERLIDLIWDDEPVKSAKALQVLVSRTRSSCGSDAIVRDGGGYRLGIEPREVDSIRLAELVAGARAQLDHDPAAAAELARTALGFATHASSDHGLLQEIRRTAAAQLAVAGVMLAQALSRTGAHAEALPALERAWAQHGGDESLLIDLLHSKAAVHGPAAALDCYEHYRRRLRERLGTNPGALAQRTQRELLALDSPVRSGLRYDPTALLGRDHDLAALRGLMREARVVSIVGAGGLGKTRLAQVLARDATLPVAHVVELVGVSAPEDVVSEIGAALGVRDSVGSRRTLTPDQRADIRARIAQRLGQSPSLLVLDNCEHVIEAVAGLVAFLVATVPELRVLTTSRAPLAIAAERVYLLAELDLAAAAELFRARAVAARPQVQLDDAVIERIVTRLDGLPLAIELAAAKVRAMSLVEIDRRLENRFALLRGGDRSAPDRHQTLLAVIDWSWNLLDSGQRRALRWLALFHDGFTLAAAEQMLGADVLDAVQGLVDQSLLKVQETGAGVRYRMLETVREFGLMQLIDAGEDAAARAARRRWAVSFARHHGERLSGTGQIAAIDAISIEEVNLADELRSTIAAEDRESLVCLLAALGTFWLIRGDHVRQAVLVEALAQALDGWHPPPEFADTTRTALTVLLSNGIVTRGYFLGPIRRMLRELGPGSGNDPRLAGAVTVMLAYDPDDQNDFAAALEVLATDPDRYVSRVACQWLSHVRENAGDPVGAAQAIRTALALTDAEDGPWHAATLRYQLGQLMVQLGERERARAHAEAALAVMERLGARDDELQLHALLSICALADGRLADAERELDQMDRIDHDGTVFAGAAFRLVGRAELAFARGEHRAALAIYRECADYMHDLVFPGLPRSGAEPWAIFGEASALAAHAAAADADEAGHGRALLAVCRDRGLRVVDGSDEFIDLPVMGLNLFGIGAWCLLRECEQLDLALQLLALADRFSYARISVTVTWELIVAAAEERAPGHLAELRERYRAHSPAELLGEARRLIAAVPV